MGWVKLDDQFFANPKVLRLRPEPKLLYLSALTYSAAHLTDGAIYQAALPAIAALAGVASRWVNTLVAAGLWDRAADGWTIHDYTDWQPTAAMIKARRQETADRQRRWRNASTPTSRNGSRHGEVAPLVTRQSHDQELDLELDSSLVVYNETHDQRATRRDDDDETDKPDTPTAALRILARRDLDRRQAERGPVGNPAAWLAKAYNRRVTQHADQLAQLPPQTIARHTPAALADLLEKPTDQPKHAGSVATIEAQERARKAAADCGQCDNGWLDTPTGLVRCDCQTDSGSLTTGPGRGSLSGGERTVNTTQGEADRG